MYLGIWITFSEMTAVGESKFPVCRVDVLPTPGFCLYSVGDLRPPRKAAIIIKNNITEVLKMKGLEAKGSTSDIFADFELTVLCCS